MIIYTLLILLSIVVFELFLLLRMSSDAIAIIKSSVGSIHILMSSKVGDDEKEALMRRGSAEIFKATVRFGAKLLLIILFLCLPFLLPYAQLSSLGREMVESLTSPVTIVLLTIVVVCYARARRTVLARL